MVEDDEFTPIYLTPIKNLPGDQIVWMKERNTERDRDHGDDDGQEFLKGLERMPMGKPASDKNKPSRKENEPRNLLHRDTLETTESDEEISRDDAESREDKEENFRKEKTRCKGKRKRKGGNKDELVTNLNQELVTDRRVASDKTVENRGELESVKQDSSKITSRQKRRLEDIIDSLLEKGNQKLETVDSNNIVEKGNVEHGFVSEESNEEKSERKQRREENEDLSDQKSVSERAEEEDIELDFATQDSAEKGCEIKERQQGNKEDDLVKECDKPVMQNKTIQENEDAKKVTSDSTKNRFQRKSKRLEGNEDASANNGNKDCVSDGLVISNNTVEENEESEFVTQVPTETGHIHEILEGTGDLVKECASDKIASTNEMEDEDVEHEVVTKKPIGRTFAQKKSGHKRNEDVPVKKVKTVTCVSDETVEGSLKLVLENEGKLRFKGNKDTLVKYCVSDKIVASNKTVEEDVEIEMATGDSTKNNCERQNNKLEEIADTSLQNETVQLEVVTQSSIEKKSKRKKKTKERNECGFDVQCVGDETSVPDKTLEGSVQREFVTQDSTAKSSRRQGKKKRLEENEEESVDDFDRRCVSDRTMVSKNAMKIHVEHECVTQESITQESVTQESVTQESVTQESVTQESITQESVTLESVTQESVEKKSKRKRQKESEDVLVKSVEKGAINGTTASKKSVQKDMKLEFFTDDPSEKKSEHKKKKKKKKKRLEEDEDEFVKNVTGESSSDRSVVSKKVFNENVDHEQVTQDFIEKEANKHKEQARLERNDDLLMNNVNQECVGDKSKVSKNAMADENVELEFVTQNPSEKKSKRKKRREERNEDELVEKDNRENSSERTTISKKTTAENVKHGLVTENTIDNKHKNKTSKRKGDKEERCSLLDSSEGSIGEKSEKLKKKVDGGGYCEDEQKDVKKLKDRKRKSYHSNGGEEGNDVDDVEKKKKKKKKEKRRSSEVNNTETETETETVPALINLEKTEALNDSGYSENSHNVFKQNKPRVPEGDAPATEATVSSKKKGRTNEQPPADQGMLVR